MADHYPITLQALSRLGIERFYGPNVGPFLRLGPGKPSNAPLALKVNDPSVPAGAVIRSYRRVEVFTRGGALHEAFAELVEQSGISELSFLGGSANSAGIAQCTHEVVNQADWRGRVRYTTIRDCFDEHIASIENLLDWYWRNPDALDYLLESDGADLDGRDFADIQDMIDNVEYSLDPNDDYCEQDSLDGSLVVATLKTLIWMLRRAKGRGEWVVCEL
jgi:hypothetical protein